VDAFSFWKWSSQALDRTGILLGWTPLVRAKIRKTANARLENFSLEAAPLSVCQSNRPRVALTAYRRMATFISSPMPSRSSARSEPPYENNGR